MARVFFAVFAVRAVTKEKRASMNDAELLREYVEDQSDSAFAELVKRHVNLVYFTALRMVRQPALAEDIAQLVFVQLARKAPAIREGNALPGWLYRVTHCQAANALRADRSRRQHEAEAMMQAELEIETAWESIESGLEEAMNTLNAAEQDLVVMRFFQERSWREVGDALALSEDTVQRRVGRALEKLRAHFVRRGVAVSASVLALTIAANAVQAAPAGLASTVAGASLAGAGAAGSSTFLTAIKIILMKRITYAILSAAIVAAVSIPIIVAKAGPTNAPVTAESLAKGRVLYFTFDRDETGGDKVTDASGQGNHGKASGVHWTADGRKGGAYEFTADGDQIEVANNESLNPAQFTLAAWIKTSFADGIWRRIFDKSYSKGFALSIAGDCQQNNWRGQVSLEIGPGNHFIVSKTNVADGQWHQVVATFDGAGEVLYVDGQPEAKLHWKTPGQAGATDFNLVIGCNRSNLTEDDLGKSFRGLIDEPMVWNRALSASEVTFLYRSQ
jgi:RNA polymerase sigma factor (sigma-70 family)